MGHKLPVISRGGEAIPDTALEFIFNYLDNPMDRSAASRVCKKWYNVDGRTRKDITIVLCYSIDPPTLAHRFSALEALKLKGKPRASMFKLVPEDWGGYAKAWVPVLTVHCPCLKSIHFRRMVVDDDDLVNIAQGRANMLQVLKLDKCSGFSTNGLETVTRSCKSLRVLLLDDSIIQDHGGTWLHELAIHNKCLEVLSFYGTDLQNIDTEDLLTIATNCKGLISLKLSEFKLESLMPFLSKSTCLRELGGLCLGSNDGVNIDIRLPSTLTSLVGLYYAGADEGDAVINQVIRPIASGLKKLDLQFAFLSVSGHCQLLSSCTNLEALEVFNAIGDEGLEVIANNCKKLRRLRVERGDREVQQGFVTQKGLTAIALSCHHLEYIAAYVSDIDNAALVTIASNCPNLRDFRLVLLDEGNDISEFPLDDGVRALMQKCKRMHRFALYLRPGCVTDRGMNEMGIYGKSLRWVLFGLLGETDMGLSLFADYCQSLEKLEIRDCVYSEAAIASAVLKMRSLKYVWVQGYKSSGSGEDLLPLCDACWRVEYIPATKTVDGLEQPVQFVAYRSLSERCRADHPPSVILLNESMV